ncbi:DUF4272 domain-containing protein [Terriglobus sp. 2YAB30_2]|uniref:DUF4272 domain-containing protein n=1 Tax=unclassified Terriglobus TaxID=2628988 RepID=UPI003F9B93B2
MQEDWENVPWLRPGARQIAERCIVLLCVAASKDFEPGHFSEWIEENGLWHAVSPNEHLLLTQPQTDKDRITALWRSEALVVLLWAIRKWDDLPSWNQQIDIAELLRHVPAFGEPLGTFVASANLRSEEEIDTVREEHYQAHWQVRDARINGKPMPPDIEPGVIYERHYAFNWLIGYDNLSWDEMEVDT